MEAVVFAAEEHEVVEVGGAAVGPVFDVVAVTPTWWPVASRVAAVSVAYNERSV